MTMLRLLIFVVAELLVSASSEPICAVCGDGYQVGNPSAVCTFPGYQDTPVRCDDIEFVGLQGLIPMRQCSFLRLLIFATCDCQPTTKETTPDYGKNFHGQGYSSRRRDQYSPTRASAPSNSVPDTPATAVPTPSADANSSNDNRGFPVWVISLPITLVGTVVIFIILCRIVHDNLQEDNLTEMIATPETLPAALPTHSIHPDPPGESTIGLELDDDAKRRRLLVLEALFPNEDKVSIAYRVTGVVCVCLPWIEEYV